MAETGITSGFGIDIEGIEDCITQLNALPPRIVKGAFGKALAAAAVPIVAALEPRTPVDTGLLVSSIKSDIAVSSEGKGGKLNIGFGKQGYVARMIEFGHRIVGHMPKRIDTGKFKDGKPFMRDATAVSSEAATTAFRDTLLASLDEGQI